MIAYADDPREPHSDWCECWECAGFKPTDTSSPEAYYGKCANCGEPLRAIDVTVHTYCEAEFTSFLNKPFMNYDADD